MRAVGDEMSAPDGARTSRRHGDEGSALILVLVMIVIGSLIVVPTMTYAMTVMRANTVLSNKSKRLEGVKSGLRIALADPKGLYAACDGGPNTPITLASTMNNGNVVTTKCYWIGSEYSQGENEKRVGVVTTQVGEPTPPYLQGVPGSPVVQTTEAGWLANTSTLSETNKTWLPNLPVHGLNLRPPGGTQMPAGYPTCTVYFPGTYADPVTLTGPTYFTSGIYYFEKPVTIRNGADVVVGAGAIEGCTSDQEAVFYAVNVPSTHNMSGLGATWVLGKQARVVVSNADASGTPISLRFNNRYVQAGVTGDLPSQGVSIETVNGDVLADGVTGTALVVPGKLEVPLSMVGSTSPVAATSQQYFPSTLTPKPQVPAAPTGVTAEKNSTAARISWTAPADGGSLITGYTVMASSGGTCSTLGALSCAITGLPTSSVTFTVTATNAIGTSAASAPATPTASASALTAPGVPARPTATAYNGVVRVTFTAPTSDGGAPITSYTVTSSSSGPGGARTCSVDVRTATTPNPLTCDVTGLDALTPYTFTVTASNAVGSTESQPSLLPVIPAVALGAPPALTVPTVPAPSKPTPVIDVDLPGTAPVAIDVPGYISMPQGRFRVSNPHGLDVQMVGGITAASFDVTDTRAAPIPIGLKDGVVLRKFRIVSTTNAGPEKGTAIVQVKEQGAYGVNSWEVQ